MRSDQMKKGLERSPHRGLFKALGLTDQEIERPMIGIANSSNEVIPGHLHLHQISDAVKDVVVIRYEGPTGGPIAIVREGDLIEIDIPGKRLNLLIPEEEIKTRRSEWIPPKRELKGYLKRYAKLVQSANTGATFE